MKKFFKSVKEEFKKKKGKAVTVYLILRFLVILCMIRQIMLGNISNVLLCILTLVLFLITHTFNSSGSFLSPDFIEWDDTLKLYSPYYVAIHFIPITPDKLIVLSLVTYFPVTLKLYIIGDLLK